MPQDVPPRVLVADDEDDIRELVTVAVRRAGCTVVAALADGPSALAAARAELPDLAVLDVSMPGATGLDVCSALRAEPAGAGVRVLLLSAGASADDVARGLAAGADAYLAKPFSVAALATKVRELTAEAGA
ncbi:response regulator transcription factor [Blastococcus sp. SYSU D00820]